MNHSASRLWVMTRLVASGRIVRPRAARSIWIGLVALACGCLSKTTQTPLDEVFRMGQVDRFEIVDGEEPVDFDPIVISERDQVLTLAEGYRDLEWTSVIATPMADPDGYRLQGYAGTEKVIDRPVFATGTFRRGYGESYARLEGAALAVFQQAIESHRRDKSVN